MKLIKKMINVIIALIFDLINIFSFSSDTANELQTSRNAVSMF